METTALTQGILYIGLAAVLFLELHTIYKKNKVIAELEAYKTKAKKVNQSNLEEIVKLWNEIVDLERKRSNEYTYKCSYKRQRDAFEEELSSIETVDKIIEAELRMELRREKQRVEEADIAILAISVEGKKVKREEITNAYFNNK